jgi:hypothetical protein
MRIKRKRIHITQLLLDSENPRHDVIKNQPEIIKQLLKTEQIYNLAKDIAKQGSLSPLEIIGILPAKNEEDYIVIEGNRRICACLLLNNPDLCPSEQLVRKFRNLQKNSDYPNEISCVVFKSRDGADHWIQLRHEGQQDGIGTKRWDASQIARYSEKRGRKSPNIQATKLLDYAANQGIITPDEKGNFSITTLQRYLNNPLVRNVFGLEDKEGLRSKHEKETFKKIVARFLEDADTGIVNSRSTQKDWQEYANTLQKEVTDPPPSDNPVIDHGSQADKDPNDKKGKPTQKSKPDPSKRKFIIPYDTKFSICDKTLNRIYLEMRKIPIEGYEFSTAYLLRAFIEDSTFLYMKKHIPDELQKESKLHSKLKLVSEHLQSTGIRPAKLHSLNIAASDKNSLISPLLLGAMVHLSVIPTKRELIAIWDRMENILHIIHDSLA